MLYNTIAVGGTNSTATHNCLCLLAEYQSYDIKRARDELTVVLFLFLKVRKLDGVIVFFPPFLEERWSQRTLMKGKSKLVGEGRAPPALFNAMSQKAFPCQERGTACGG